MRRDKLNEDASFVDEAEILTYITPVTIQLPDDYKGKNFKVFAESRMNGRNLQIYHDELVRYSG